MTIFAIGDIHGDMNHCIQTLKLANVLKVNKSLKIKSNDINELTDFFESAIEWIGEDKIVIQVGDQVDRCRPSAFKQCKDMKIVDDENSDIKILVLMNVLHNKAIKHGGRVYSLLGNHEIMNVMGDMRYVSRQGLLGFGDDVETGLENRKRLFAKGNEYAKLLANTRHAIIIVDDYIFVHGGLVPHFLNNNNIKSKKELLKINKKVKKWLLNKLTSKEENDLIINILQGNTYVHNDKTYSDSVFWNRMYGNISPDEEKDVCKTLNDIIEVVNFKGMVIGHTPQFRGINSTCSDKVWRVDYGGSDAFDSIGPSKKVQVLKIDNNNFEVLSTNKIQTQLS